MTDDAKDPIPYERPDADGHPRGKQKGAQQHAEGEQGPVTRKAFLEQLHSGPSGDESPTDEHPHDDDGKQRLFERREQHDVAEQQSEKNRLDRDIREHGHNRENFQVEGGSAAPRVGPSNPINPTEPNAPTPGEAPAARPKRVPGVGGS